MRVLAVHPGPGFSVVDVFRGWVKGLRSNGVDVIPLDLGERLRFYTLAHYEAADGTFKPALTSDQAVKLAAKTIEAACYEVWPDVVLVTSGFYIPEPLYGLLRARGHKVVRLVTEEPYETEADLERAPHVDLNILNDPTNLDAFRAVAPSEYIAHAYDPTIHCPGPVSHDLRSDFAFCGTGFKSRTDLFEAVDWTGVDVAFAGYWQDTGPDSPIRKALVHDIDECFDNADTVDLYRSTRLSANVYREAHGWAMGPREVELAAIGTPFLRQPRGEGDDVLGFLPTFTEPSDFTAQMRWLLHHDDLRLALGRQCREAVAGRTFAANAAQLLRLLDKQR